MLNKIYKTLVLSCVLLIAISFVGATKIYLSSNEDKLISNCPTNIDIMIDSKWQEFFGASVNMSYDRKNIQIDWFYLNDEFNLPLDVDINEYDDFANIKGAALSLIRNPEFKQIWFSGVVRFATMVVKNKELINSTKIDFLFSGNGITTDNMDVFRLWDAKDILKEVEWKTFEFIDGECLHTAPDGLNQLDDNYNFKSNLDKNLKSISNLEKMYPYKKFVLQYRTHGIILILIAILVLTMYKKWMLSDIRILKNKGNKND